MIIGLFSQLNGAGGIQRIGRHTAASIVNYAKNQNEEYSFFSLNDTEGKNELQIEDINFKFVGFEKKKVSLISSVVKMAKQTTGIYINHVNLCPIGFLMKIINPKIDYWVEIYGIDAWDKLSFFKFGLLKKLLYIH